MDQSYGIKVTNRFSLGGEDDIEDPEDFIKETTSKIEKAKSPSQGTKGKKQDSNKKKQEIDTKPRKEDPKDSRPDSRRGGRGRNSNNVANSRPPRKGREGGKRQEYTESVEDQENQAPNDLRNDRNERPPRSFGGRPPREDRPPRSFGDRFGERSTRDGEYGDRPPRGRGGRGRGGRGRGFGSRGGRREFDRHSGSDKSSSFKPQDKREGGGNHNWGNFKDDVKEVSTTNAVETFTAEEWDSGEPTDVKTVPDKVEGEDAGPKEGEGGQDGEEQAEKEPEVQEMTLDEYKAMQASSRPKPEFKIRQPGEGENKGQWKKTYVLKKTAAQAEADKELEHHEDSIYRDKPKSKDQVGIQIQFNDQPTRGGRGGRRGVGGGRGRGRGGRGGGGGRGGRSRSDEAHISLTDHNQFPSLDGN